MEAAPQAPPRMGVSWGGQGAVVAQEGRLSPPQGQAFMPPLPNAIIALAPLPLSHVPPGGQPGVSAGPQVLHCYLVNRGSTFVLRRSTLDVCLGGQRSWRAAQPYLVELEGFDPADIRGVRDQICST